MYVMNGTEPLIKPIHAIIIDEITIWEPIRKGVMYEKMKLKT